MTEKKLSENRKGTINTSDGRFIEIDFKTLDALLQFKVNKNFVSDYMKVSEDTIDNRIREKFNMTYTQYKNLRSGTMSLKLQQKAIELATKGDVQMLKFSLKNMSGWSENTEEKESAEEITINIDADDAEL